MKKNILVTGSTDGIGKESAIAFAKLGHNIFLHGRNEKKILEVCNEIEALTGVRPGYFIADFSNLKSVQDMALEVLKLDRLDILVNNAGIFNGKDDCSIDLRFRVNYLAAYLLTNLILPVLEKSFAPRIINLSSAAQSSVDLESMILASETNDNKAYAQSKLALTMWNTYFAKKYPNIISIALNPGSLLDTKLAFGAYKQIWSKSDKGSSIIVDLALSDEFKDSTGLYFDNDLGEKRGKFSQAHIDAYDLDKIDHLIEITEEIIK
ncbi:MAG: SDR family NAD(P)-dependent oxidoreductase [Psittacicella sp.]